MLVITASFGWHFDEETGIASCGYLRHAAIFGTEITVAEPTPAAPKTFRTLPDGTVGHIMIRGSSLTPGYYNKPELNAKVFNCTVLAENSANGDEAGEGETKAADVDGDDTPASATASHGWFDTGDLGFVRNGQLYVSGRSKDLIIVAGRNIWPTDIERYVEAQHPTKLRLGTSMAVQMGPSDVYVLCERRPGARLSEAEVEALTGAVEAKFGVGVTLEVHEKKTLPKTTSGKVSAL